MYKAKKGSGVNFCVEGFPHLKDLCVGFNSTASQKTSSLKKLDAFLKAASNGNERFVLDIIKKVYKATEISIRKKNPIPSVMGWEFDKKDIKARNDILKLAESLKDNDEAMLLSAIILEEGAVMKMPMEGRLNPNKCFREASDIADGLIKKLIKKTEASSLDTKIFKAAKKVKKNVTNVIKVIDANHMAKIKNSLAIN